MADTTEPVFRTLEEEREFWQSHDAFEVLGENGWEAVPEGYTEASSIYLTAVGPEGAVLRLPLAVLTDIGLRSGGKLMAHVEGRRLVVEPA